MSASRRMTDDRNRVFAAPSPSSRIVSLVPSDTLNVAALGCAQRLVGRTDYCDLPAHVVAGIPSVGGTKNPRIDDIVRLEPDLILANQEENTRSDLETLAQRGLRVYVAFPKRVAEGFSHLSRLARLFGVEREPAVRALVKRAYEELRVAEHSRAGAGATPLRVFCPIWMNPLMTIHGDTFISDMLDLCGAYNVFSDRPRRYPLAADLGRADPLPPDKIAGRDVRYPRVTLEEIVARAPDLVLLPDEPHPFSDEDAAVFRSLAVPAAARGAVVSIDGKDLCWYGARSVEGITRLRAIVARFR